MPYTIIGVPIEPRQKPVKGIAKNAKSAHSEGYRTLKIVAPNGVEISEEQLTAAAKAENQTEATHRPKLFSKIRRTVALVIAAPIAILIIMLVGFVALVSVGELTGWYGPADYMTKSDH